jgi:hypothetical protein
VTLADRMMRFLAASIVVHLLFGWLEYLAWRSALRHDGTLDVAQFALLWASALIVIGFPTAVGWALGTLYATRNARGTHNRLRRLLRLDGDDGAPREAHLLEVALGHAPAPRAWDHLFGSSPSALIRMQLQSGGWVGGFFGSESYASSYPETSGDIYLEQSVQVEADGSFSYDDDGNLVELGGGTLVRWDEVRIMDLFEYAEVDDGTP